MGNIREFNGVPVTECLPYIHLANSLYYTNLAYPQETYILYTIDIWYDIIIPEFYIMFFVIYDCVIVTYNSLWQLYIISC